ncbi:MAG: hypothetical protein LIO79_03445 [Rikenellaceae bacterium]|nr:hypothetical protein [Rikenellaceae bacterium]
MRISLLFLLIIGCLSGSSQKINRDYSFLKQQNGNLYFIHPMNGFKSSDKNIKKDMEYDMTYLTATDSVSFIFSVYTYEVAKLDSLRIIDVNGAEIYSTGVEMIYVKPRKKYWIQRAGITVPYELLSDLYKKDEPYSIVLHGGESEIIYKMAQGKWRSQSDMVNKIFDVIEYNL